ncbi:MAG TPA: hypothetical protein VFQ76_01855 [Longimicrobiaceae bacterium]|nr:hypothetical protein [Longimicrobiaceae bacterium]
MKKTRARLLLAAAMPLAIALAACEPGSITTEPVARGDTLKAPPASPVQPPRFVSGRYVLARVAGKPLPALYYNEGGTRGDYTAGVLQLNQDGTFASDYTIHFSSVRNGAPYDWQIRLTGQYEIRGDSIRYRATEATGTSRPTTDIPGVIGGDSVTIFTHTVEQAVYLRQP